MKPRRQSPAPGRPGALQRLASAHGQALFDSLGRLWRQPLGSALSAFVLGLALALPTALQTLLLNLGAAGEGWRQSQRELSLVLRETVDDSRARALARELAQQPQVARAEARSRDQALAEFEAHSGLGDAIALLPENPLPAMLLIQPAAELGEAELARLAEQLRALPEAEELLVDAEWLQRLHALLAVLERVVTIVAAGLGVAVLVIVGNTIRLEVAARHEEIEVMQLIGASDAFIRRPFVYAGLWYGLIGGLLALLMVALALLLLQAPVGRLAGLYAADFRLHGPGAGLTLQVLLAGCGLGWLGARLAVARQLRAITPEASL